jgi:phosphohistidine phosphatase
MDAMQDRRLIVMRHAKAGELPGGPDEERALRARGRRDAAAAGQWLRQHDFVPDMVICSAARRARQTWQAVGAELGARPAVSNDRGLYTADAGQLLRVIRQTPPAVTTLMYVGHNPAAGQVAAQLTGRERDFPTAAIAVIEVPGTWAALAPGAGRLAASWVPRMAGLQAENGPARPPGGAAGELGPRQRQDGLPEDGLPW